LVGSNTTGVYAQSCNIDFEVAASPSTVVVQGACTFVHNDSANLTLFMDASATFGGYARLAIAANATNNSKIVLNSTDVSGYQAIIDINANATFTNGAAGMITASGTNGSAQITMANPSTFINSGTISVRDSLGLLLNVSAA